MSEVPGEIPRMRRGAEDAPSLQPEPARSLPAWGNFLAELSSFIPLSSSKNHQRGREEDGGGWGVQIIHRECF